MTVQARYRQAKLSVADRVGQVAAVVTSLEEDLELLCLTGVEDKLQVSLILSIIVLSYFLVFCCYSRM